MNKRTKRLVKASRALYASARTFSGNDEPTWLVPRDELLALGDALECLECDLCDPPHSALFS